MFHLDHIGIAVQSIEKTHLLYSALGFKKSGFEIVESEGVKVLFYELSNGARLELLEPLNERSPVFKFIQKRGEGIHHISLKVKNLKDLLKKLKNLGVSLINEEPKIGASNRKIAFIHPRSMGGVLYELIEEEEKKT